MSESRGGPHGEEHKKTSASHDDEKKDNEDFTEAQASEEVGTEVQEVGRSSQRETASCEERQSQQSSQSIDEVNSQETESVLMEESVTSPKATLAKIIGGSLNDPRVTNVLMVILVLVGMGGAEFVQTQACSL